MVLRGFRLLALIAVVLLFPAFLTACPPFSAVKSSFRVPPAPWFSAMGLTPWANGNAVSSSTTTTVASSSPTITLGDTVTFTATVTVNSPGTGTPTGLVTFFDRTTPLGSAPLNVVGGNDQATYTTAILGALNGAFGFGTIHSITAVYDGDANFSTSPLSAAINQTVKNRTATTSLSLNPTTVFVGQPSTATVTVTDAGSSFPPGTPDTFATTGAPATGRAGSTATLFADGQVLVAGGTDVIGNVLQSAEIYSLSGGAFNTTGNLNTARTGAIAVLLPNGKVLIAGGSSDGTENGALNSAELFDPGTGTFTPSSQNMIAARFGMTATLLINGQVLLAGGENSGGVLNSGELYNPATDSFAATGSLNTARTGAGATLLPESRLVLIVGGSSDGTAAGALDTSEIFDFTFNNGAGAFEPLLGTLSAARWQPEVVALQSQLEVLIAGGSNSSGVLTSADIMNEEDRFSSVASQMSTGLANGSAFLLSSRRAMLVGSGGQAVQLFDPFVGFVNTGNLLQSDNGLVATLLDNGQVLAVGLTSGGKADAELYTPSFNPLGGVGLTSSVPSDVFGSCFLTPSTSTASTCSTTVTPVAVATSPHTITASGIATASLTVNPAGTTMNLASSANPSVFGQPVAFTATVTDSSAGSTVVPTGAVQFVVDGVNFGSPVPLAQATANSSTAALSTGALGVSGSPHTVTANYTNIDGNFINSTTSLSGGQMVTAAATSTAVGSSLSPTIYGLGVSFTAIVSNTATGAAAAPTGTVQFVVDGQNFGAPVTLTPGNNGNSTATSGTTTTLTVNSGSPHTVAVNYTNTDKNFSNGSGSLSGGLKVSPAPLTITANNLAVTYNNASFTAFSASLTGFVNGETEAGLRNSGTLSGGAGFSGAAIGAVNAGVYTINPTVGTLTAGNYVFSILQSGTLIISKANTTSHTTVLVTLVNNTANPADLIFQVVVTSTTGGTPTGAVLLTDDQNSAVSANVPMDPSGCPSGTPATASCVKFNFAPGQLVTGAQTISANYQGDNNFNSTSSGSTPSSAEVTIVPAINTSPGQSIPPQTITFDNAAAFAGQNITLSCSVQAATIPTSSDFPACSLSATTLPANGSVIVNISTVARSNAGLIGAPNILSSRPARSARPLASSAAVLSMPAIGFLGLVLIGGAARSLRRGARVRILLSFMLMLCVFLLAAGCGGSPAPPPPPPGNSGTPSGIYLVSVTGTDVNHNQVLVATISLNVQ